MKGKYRKKKKSIPNWCVSFIHCYRRRYRYLCVLFLPFCKRISYVFFFNSTCYFNSKL